LIALGKLNRLELLADLYGEVHIPQAVYDEVVWQGIRRGEPDAHVVRLFLTQRQWPIVDVAKEMLTRVTWSVTLGHGETAVLALATTLNSAIVLMDDALARSEARRLKLPVYGTLGILVQAYQKHYLSLPEVELLIQNIAARADIWISAQLCQRVLAHLHNSSSFKT
jgi:predicted nucleic acid-binding protein